MQIIHQIAEGCMPFLHFLQDIRTPVLDKVFSTVTLLGEETFFLVIAIWPEGAAIKVLDNVIHGVFGDACFIISIP